jgi:hypothetical protein
MRDAEQDDPTRPTMRAKKHTGPGSPPTSRDLERSLGRASVHWARLHADLAAEFGPLAEKWSYSGKTARWSLRLKQRKRDRTILYLIVCQGHFLAAFALGEKASRAARESGLPVAVLEAIEAAPKYAEGRGVWLEVRSKRDADGVRRLASIKLAN